MRHIPEEELHAYLDQALSRSQCVEIEHHLAECTSCRIERDAIAALRDRTTSLLVAAAPRRIRPRPFTQVSTAHVERQHRRAARIRALAWAASVVAAVGLGWVVSRATAPVVPVPQLQATGPTASTTTTPKVASASPRRTAPAERVAPPTPVRLAGLPVTHPVSADSTASRVPPRPATSELASLGGTGTASEPVLDGMWRTVSWASAQNDGDDWLPRVEGVPVVQVKVRRSEQGGRPLTLVTQQLASGEMISTVEGPSPEVAALLSRQPGQSASAELQDMQVNPRPADSASGRPAATPAGPPRTLAIFGSAPSDSLKAFMLRVK